MFWAIWKKTVRFSGILLFRYELRKQRHGSIGKLLKDRRAKFSYVLPIIDSKYAILPGDCFLAHTMS